MKIVLDTPVSSVIFTTRPHGRREAELYRAPDKGKAIMPVDVSSALDLRLNHHLSYSEIAAIQGVSPQAIHGRIKNLLPPDELNVYKDHRADILAGLQAKILSHLDDKRLSKASAYQLVGSAGLLYDKERLERGMSTANLASLTADIAAYKRSKVVFNPGAGDGPTGK